MQVFNNQVLEDFETRVYLHLTSEYASARCTTENEVRQLIRLGIQRANGYRITTEYDVARFIDLMYLLSPDFDSNPQSAWIRDVLSDPQIPDDKKMDLIYDKA